VSAFAPRMHAPRSEGHPPTSPGTADSAALQIHAARPYEAIGNAKIPGWSPGARHVLSSRGRSSTRRGKSATTLMTVRLFQAVSGHVAVLRSCPSRHLSWHQTVIRQRLRAGPPVGDTRGKLRRACLAHVLLFGGSILLFGAGERSVSRASGPGRSRWDRAMNRAWLEEQIRVRFGSREAALVAALHEVQVCVEFPEYYAGILQMYPNETPTGAILRFATARGKQWLS
jgi:hypothetical protein